MSTTETNRTSLLASQGAYTEARWRREDINHMVVAILNSISEGKRLMLAGALRDPHSTRWLVEELKRHLQL